MVKRIWLIIILIFIAHPNFGQAGRSVEQRRAELEEIKSEIAALETEYKEKSLAEKESVKTLENLNRQKMLINKLINKLLDEERVKEIAIDKIQSDINSVEEKIRALKDEYSRYIVWLYKNRGLSFLKFLISADSFNQTFKRYQYLRFITQNSKSVLAELTANKRQLNELSAVLSNEKHEKEILVAQKLAEQKTLASKEAEGRLLLNRLKKEQKNLLAELELKRKTEIQIKNIIAKLVEDERARKAKLIESRNEAKKTVPYYNYELLAGFAELKGKLSWPVKNGTLIRKFGENKNLRLNTVTLNYGVDIMVKGSRDVYSIAEGIVSAVEWIPGYGSVVIITHRDQFRTVYGHVSEITIGEGDKVEPGTRIGAVSESLEGTILHFEIWNERNYQNPEVWFSRK